ncbi:ABC transporter G family member 23-like [Chironomus tepperi]|uniref:ABC transporter G family member 23-like n=1 Tax=Chironomus tepperi TaxID=113505 RepID=UPI00391FB910
MPQEISLPMAMSIKETVTFFANISQMDMTIFKERYEMLMGMLELKSENTLIDDLSGGEKRRVSFIVALIHNPQLLILDEPSAGLDVVIVQKIWDFMRESVKLDSNLTILMTTHYPHEAEKADICGFMRNGKLLAANSPKKIMEILNVQNLDEASLRLCYNRNVDSDVCTQTGYNVTDKLDGDNQIYDSKRNVLELRTIKALIRKKVLWTNQSKSILLATLLPPFYLFILLIFTIGRPPQDLKLGIVNDENIDCNNLNIDYNCQNEGISCFFINTIPDNKAQKITYKSFHKASNDSQKGIIGGFVHIPSNYSTELLKIQNILDFGESNNSHISVYLDHSDIHRYKFANMLIYKAYEDFIDKLMPKCDKKPALFKSNVIFRSYKNDSEQLNFEIDRSTMPAVYLL